MADDATRDRVRALVRDVLSKAMPESAPPTSSPQIASSKAPKTSSTTPGAVTRDESAKLVITEDDVRGLERGAVLRIAENARLTPLAADIVNDRGIEIVRRVPRSGSKQHKSVAIGADHGGYPMKEELKKFLTDLGHRVHDFGTNSESAVDYPDFAHAVARAVSDGAGSPGERRASTKLRALRMRVSSSSVYPNDVGGTTPDNKPAAIECAIVNERF